MPRKISNFKVSTHQKIVKSVYLSIYFKPYLRSKRPDYFSIFFISKTSEYNYQINFNKLQYQIFGNGLLFSFFVYRNILGGERVKLFITYSKIRTFKILLLAERSSAIGPRSYVVKLTIRSPQRGFLVCVRQRIAFL